MEISACVKYVGVNDHQVDLFEGQYKVCLLYTSPSPRD